MRFAITDIETTGSHASACSIIEIGICVVENGVIIEEFHSLLHPAKPLPPFIKALTGIDDDMLAAAPSFYQIADELEAIFQNAIFVAHNVNFDYSFIKAEFAAIEKTFTPARLCTIKLARKAFPGMKSYGLGNLCRDLEIINDAPHRALGDARATTILFNQCINRIEPLDIKKMLGRNTTEAFLPQHIDRKDYDRLPERTGVYYFLDQSGKPIYIGKAKNIKKRVRQHFGGDLESSKLQGFIKDIHHIDFRETGQELIALLWEDAEIRKHWPKYNRAQKNRVAKYDVISYSDQRGYLRWAVHKSIKGQQALRSFTSSLTARSWMIEQAEKYQIDLRLIGMDALIEKNDMPSVESHNHAMLEVMEKIKEEEKTYVLHHMGKAKGERAFILIEKGIFKGIGFSPYEVQIANIDQLSDFLEPLPVTEINQSIALSYIENPRGWQIETI
jgi:DNA polymerase-3 subunit epsilon